MTILFISAILSIGLLEGYPLLRQHLWKELVVMSTLLSLAFLLVVINRFGWPTPVNILERLLEPVGRAVFK